MTNPHLPQEILIEIFSRFPAKSVGRCRTLSKFWKTNLSTPDFNKKHLFTRKQTIQVENVALVKKFTNFLYDSLCIITSPSRRGPHIDYIRFSDEYECSSILGSCNGLLLVNSVGCMILINPITGKKVTIPHKKLGNCMYGLGYDSCTDDFKIVEIRDDGLVDVYSVKNGVWKTLDDGCDPYYGYVPNKVGAFVNGALHFLFCNGEGYRSCAVFDLVTEVFTEIPLPREFVRQPVDYRRYGVSVVNGCLFIVDNLENGVGEVWIMKDYGVEESWVKFLFEPEEREMNWITAMLCYVEYGVILFLTSRCSLFTCELINGRIWEAAVEDHECRYFHGMAFVDSLVSPE